MTKTPDASLLPPQVKAFGTHLGINDIKESFKNVNKCSCLIIFIISYNINKCNFNRQ